MVSQAPLSKNPPLSYADRAKKAQNAGQKSSSSQRVFSQAMSTGATSTSNIATSGPSTIPRNEGNAVESPSLAAVPPASSPQSVSPLPSQVNANGDVKHPVNDSLAAGPPAQTETFPTSASISDSISPQPPAVNVWNLRKEQMAQARARSNHNSIQKPLSSANHPPLQEPHLRGSSILQEQNTRIGTASSSTSQPVVTAGPAAAAGRSAQSMTNGNGDAHSEGSEAAVLRPQARALQVADDEENWPEVGKMVSQASSVSGHVEGEQAGGYERDTSREGSQGHAASRKSAFFLFAPYQTLRPVLFLCFSGSFVKKRNGYQYLLPSYKPPLTPRVHNNLDIVRNICITTSPILDMPRPPQGLRHLRQARRDKVTGSAQSSPPAGYGRGGRHLPEEGVAGPPTSSNAASKSVSMRPSRAGSPQAFQTVLPPPEFVPNSMMGYRALPPSLTRSGPSPAEHIQDPSSMNNTMPPYYASPPPIPPPVSAQRSYHSPHSSGSPVQPPYPLQPHAPVPHMYGAPSGQGPIHLPYAGTPPYPVYPSYSYGYPPYMYWSAGPVSHSPVAPDGVPPATVLMRPPPQTDADVTGYRDTGFVLPPPATYDRPREKSEGGLDTGGDNGFERGRRIRELSFGSIGATVDSGSPGPPIALPTQSGVLGLDVGRSKEVEQEGSDTDKPIPPFAIGVAPGESGPARIRSRTRTTSKGPTLAPGEAFSVAISTTEQSGPVQAGEVDTSNASTVVRGGEMKWQFGSTVEAEEYIDMGGRGTDAVHALPANTTMGSDSLVSEAGEVVPVVHVDGTNHVPLPLEGHDMTVTNGLATAHSPSYGHLAPPSTSDPGSPDDLRVKDYGFGFGRKPGYQPSPTSEERGTRDKRDWQDREPVYGRPRRGSLGGGFGYDRGGHDRGGYSGRRGRGMGYAGRGGYHSRAHSRGGGAYQAGQARQPPFIVQPALQPLQTDMNGFYSHPPPQMTTYYTPTPTYETYPAAYSPVYPPPLQSASSAPPVPQPQSPLSFPLDPTRYFLLGQLEYYLSPQNVVQDFYLRQQARIQYFQPLFLLIAYYRRWIRLTMDLSLVTDVLTLSSLVEVQSGHVRMRQWEQYVLPNASQSTVEEAEIQQQPQEMAQQTSEAIFPSKGPSSEIEECDEGEDEEEEDVVFVLERD
ncbi:uncharacterized protein FIBRA_04603 [Fibroporia radiculosa]|uniref:HTH La-type RNA-binding domain-containing protein n=1 Tax=Fibroporia radiculosa TaxID=599839 RepID=J4IA91_9APHY|nr:uncharacterized protein FIBRA_04603 [Fibroporia radiculosa]CCM02501.1 predicted protein [Fibroporia radiculosa]